MVSERLLRRFYPDDTRNGTVAFYGWIREHIGPRTELLNLGAGPPTGTPIRVFKGQVARVVGADIDPIVLDNPELDDAVLIQDGRLPLEDASFDVIVSDFTLEHVEEPAAFLGEAHRVLRPGGLFVALENRLLGDPLRDLLGAYHSDVIQEPFMNRFRGSNFASYASAAGLAATVQPWYMPGAVPGAENNPRQWATPWAMLVARKKG